MPLEWLKKCQKDKKKKRKEKKEKKEISAQRSPSPGSLPWLPQAELNLCSLNTLWMHHHDTLFLVGQWGQWDGKSVAFKAQRPGSTKQPVALPGCRRVPSCGRWGGSCEDALMCLVPGSSLRTGRCYVLQRIIHNCLAQETGGLWRAGLCLIILSPVLVEGGA